MSAIKDRVVCVPIPSNKVMETLVQLPRLPSDAGLVPIKLKRRQQYKNCHLQEFVDVEKVHRCLNILKKLGHPEYQFYSQEAFETYVSRCKQEDPEGFEMLFDPDVEMSVDDDENSSHGVNDDERGGNDDQGRPTSRSLEDIERVEKEEEVPSKEEPLDDIERAEKEEEHYQKNDAAAKFAFDYDRTACFINDAPEIEVKTHTVNEPVSVSPGEGNKMLNHLF